MALRLIAKQWEALHKEIPEENGFTAEPLSEDMLHWKATLSGPEDSPYAGGKFFLQIDFTADYPFKPPKVTFLTKVYHPNVDSNGKICADFLQLDWKPTYTIKYVLMATSSLMLHPNPENAVSQTAAELYVKEPEKFHAQAQQMTLEFASK